jgi:RNA polymerase sigma-70 factor (ECF subfamily)
LHDDRRRRFELLALPHMDAAYNLARWLAGNAADAEDVLQEAYLRAYRFFDGFRGPDFRVWLLSIVRNTFHSWARENRSTRLLFLGDEQEAEAAGANAPLWSEPAPDPEAVLLRAAEHGLLGRLVAELPVEYREVLLLREVEELSYREIATVIGRPAGTVMSRLARARERLRRAWLEQGAGSRERAHGM